MIMYPISEYFQVKKIIQNFSIIIESDINLLKKKFYIGSFKYSDNSESKFL
jgi:hypothetical protein